MTTIAEANAISHLIRWITGHRDPFPRTTEQARKDAELLAGRAYKVLMGGIRPEQVTEQWPDRSPAELAAEIERLKVGLAAPEESDPEFPATWSGGHALVVEYGDEELYGRCQCGRELGRIRPNQSIDTTLAQSWERHVMTEVDR